MVTLLYMFGPQSEFALIEWLRRQTAADGAVSSSLSIPLGDDCAGLNLQGRGELLVTTDIRLDGTHFDTKKHDGRQIGHKALACSLSDIAAMAGVPVAAVVAVALPRTSSFFPDNPHDTHSFRFAQQLWEGMKPLAERFGCPVVGGDTTTWAGPLAICVTCLGVSDGIGPIRRSTAKSGDVIYVTGQLGGSILGKHLHFLPRVNEARTLAASARINSLMDLSDGLASDLRHICELSGVRAELEEAALLQTADPDAKKLAEEDGKPLLEHVLCDGEDFELLFTAAADQQAVIARLNIGSPMTPIGRILSGDSNRPLIEWIGVNGMRHPLHQRGYEHR